MHGAVVSETLSAASALAKPPAAPYPASRLPVAHFFCAKQGLTVKTHVRNVLMKLQARDRTQAALIGVRLGLVDWPEVGFGR